MANRHLIVVEGADCMGKTHLVNQLHGILGWSILHTGGPKTDEQLEAMCKVVEAVEVDTIVDRVPFLSEIAYRPLSRDPVPLEKQEELLDRFTKLSPIVVLCRRGTLPDLRIVKRPHKPLEHWNQVLLGYSGIVDRYDDLANSLLNRGVSVFSYDWAENSGQPALENLKRWLDWKLYEREGI